METYTQNLFIVEDNPTIASNLMNFLKTRFHQTLNITTFMDGETALRNINNQTAIVILDYDLRGERADRLLVDIKKINPNTEVIVYSSDEEIGTAIDAYRNGARKFVRKGRNDLKRIFSTIYKILYYPVEVTKRFFGLDQLFAIFVVEILYIAVVVYIGLKLFAPNF
jgi:DNA-binding NtrC family response regulator